MKDFLTGLGLGISAAVATGKKSVAIATCQAAEAPSLSATLAAQKQSSSLAAKKALETLNLPQVVVDKIEVQNFNLTTVQNSPGGIVNIYTTGPVASITSSWSEIDSPFFVYVISFLGFSYLLYLGGSYCIKSTDFQRQKPFKINYNLKKESLIWKELSQIK